MTFNVKNWIKDAKSSSTDTGQCASWTNKSDEKKYSSTTAGHKRFDHYVCGNSATGCYGLSNTEWQSIWDNCSATSPADNFDKCYNSVIQSDVTAGKEFKSGCNGDEFSALRGGWNGGSSNPEVEGPCAPGRCGPVMCGGTCFSDESCLDWWHKGNAGTMSWGRYGARTPAYPTKIGKGGPVKALYDNSTFRTTRGDVNTCPSNMTRSFTCAGDGNSEASGIPGCGSGFEIDGSGLEDEIRFCSRNTTNYNSENLMNCCLNEKGDNTKSSYKNCPVGYCRSAIDYDAAALVSGSNSCEDGVGEGTDLKCYKMTDECNNLFKEQCTGDLFDSRETGDYDRQTLCRNWANIQPTLFSQRAESICNIKRRLRNFLPDDVDWTDASNEHIKEILMSSDASTRNQSRRTVTSLFESQLCRDWLITEDLEKTNSMLLAICESAVVEDSSGDWKKTAFGRTMGPLCACFYPDEYYGWYKLNELSEGERNTVGNNIRPECFHRECTLSTMYGTEALQSECPNIMTCHNELTTQVTVVSASSTTNPLGALTIPSSSNSQACDFDMYGTGGTTGGGTTSGGTTSGGTTSGGTTDGGTTGGGTTDGGTTGGGTTDGDGYGYSGGNTGGYSGSGNYGSGEYNSGGYSDTDTGTSSSSGESNTMLYLGIGFVFCMMFMMFMMMAGGKKSAPSQPMIISAPSPAYAPPPYAPPPPAYAPPPPVYAAPQPM
jgi:hypothetical protein